MTLIAPLEIEDNGVMRRAVAADFVGPAGPAGPAGPGGAGAIIQAAGVDQPQRAKLNFTGSLTVADDAANNRTNVSVDISGLATVAALAAETSARAAADATLVSLVPATAARNTIQPSADVVPLTVKGAVSQTANLQEWQNSTGAVKASIAPGGEAAFRSAAGTALTLTFGNSPWGFAANGTGIDANWSGGGALRWYSANAAIINRTRTQIGQDHAASDVPLIVKGAASQSANLVEWQDSAAAVQGSVSPSGQITGKQLRVSSTFDTGGGVYFWHPTSSTYKRPFYFDHNASKLVLGDSGAANIGVGIDANSLSASFSNGDGMVVSIASGAVHELVRKNYGWASRIVLAAPADIGLVVQGAASQSGDLQQWQDSTAVAKAKIGSGGAITGLSLRTTGGGTDININSGGGIGAPAADNMLYSTYSAHVLGGQRGTESVGGLAGLGAAVGHVVVPLAHTSRPGLVVKHVASGTGNLQEWQDSTAAIKASVNSVGEITGASLFGGRVEANRSTSAQVSVGYDGSSNAATVAWGQSRDVQLRRLAAGVLTLYASGTLPTAPTMTGAGLVIQDVTTAPSTNPVGGGVLYSEAGALKWRGTAGTITQLAAA